MDRASFLRSLPYLRQLPPSVWNQCCLETSTSSCSTASPPTPRSENDLPILLDEGFAVSIEPIYRGVSRKRGRHDDGSITGRPAFFQHLEKKIELSEPPGIVNIAKKKDETENQTNHDFIHEINYDPAMCSFEVAIINRRHMFSSSILGIDRLKNNALTTPNARTTSMDIDQDDTDEIYDLHSKILLFRFGNCFVFEANPSAIVKVEHHPEHGEGAKNQDDGKTNAVSNGNKSQKLGDRNEEAEVTKIGEDSHQSKRQRIEDDKNIPSNKRLCPASLSISFASCSFRVFSVENCKESNKIKLSNAWNTPANSGTRLMNAQSKILQQFDIHNRDSSPWASSPFDVIESKTWSSCLGRNLKPSQKVSPTKTDSSSTHFENGQKQLSDPNPIENNSDPNAHARGDKGYSEKHSEDVILDERKSSKQQSPENSSSQKDSKAEDVIDASKCEDDSGDYLSNQKSFMNEISSKRRFFDRSWSLMQESASNSVNTSLLTSCAESLNHSYCNLKQHADFAHYCDVEIDTTTSEIETLLEEMMPARGKPVEGSKPSRLRLQSGKSAEQDVDLEERLDDLLCLRKAAVAAKFSLFLVPKR